MSLERPRYSHRPLPPYSYVPSHSPHPVSDPAGHMYGVEHEAAQALDPDHWQASDDYCFGIDLFNQGFYWEAHEAWEALWHAAGRKGTLADFLKGLIKFAAAMVKAREGNPRGVRRHAVRAKELITGIGSEHYAGLSIATLIEQIEATIDAADSYDQARPDFLASTVLLPDER